jgi:hypothetical protein
MGMIYSFGYGSKDAETPPKIMEWISEHVYSKHTLGIALTHDVPDGVEFIDED